MSTTVLGICFKHPEMIRVGLVRNRSIGGQSLSLMFPAFFGKQASFHPIVSVNSVIQNFPKGLMDTEVTRELRQ